MTKLKITIKVIALLLIAVFIFSQIQLVLTVKNNPMEYQWMTSIYQEPKDSLDAVYIGSSSCYSYWNPLFGWNNYGIAVLPYCCSYQPLEASEALIREARKTQPDALYIVNINTLGDGSLMDTTMHRVIDYMPLSLNKLQLIDTLCDLNDFGFSERLEYYIPLVRYHSAWKDVTSKDFNFSNNGLKGVNKYSWYFETVENITDKYLRSDQTTVLSDALMNTVSSLMEYCKEEDVNVLFVAAPRAETTLERLGKINTVKNILTEGGFKVLYLMDKTEEIGLYTEYDFYNATHCNVHGAIKYTNYMSRYLIENYGFEDKRGDEAYQSWDSAFTEYKKLMAAYVLKTEHNSDYRDYKMPIPKNLAVTKEGKNAVVSWDAVEGAEGYEIYRMPKKVSNWQFVADTDQCSFTNKNCAEGDTYVYRVVPYYTVNGEKVYGEYWYKGREVAF